MGTRDGVSSVGSKEVDKAMECDFGLGLRMQTNKSYFLMSNHHQSTQLLPSSSSNSCFSGGFDGGGGAGGPMFYSRSNGVACFGDIYDVVRAGSASPPIDAMAGSKSLQSFTSSSFPFNPPGEMVQSVNGRVPFTAAQWQELERQTMIYRYLMASVPVPPELLIPISRTQSNTSSSQSHVVKGSLELGISSCNSDPEPWRCKRTDGKKWRCSRDVAPDQKYCERHSHKSRPRSRKPVELHTDSMANTTNNFITNTNLANQKSHFQTQASSNLCIFSSAMASAATSYDQPRNLEWFLKGETVPVTGNNSNQEWHHLKGESAKCDEKIYRYREEQLVDSSSYTNLRVSHSLQAHRLNDNCSLLLSPKSGSINPSSSQTAAQETRHFLDVWSSTRNECSVPSSEKLLPPSTLTLSMCGGSEQNTENGFGMSHGSWMGSPPGGPLAEALCLGISTTAKADSNLTSSHGSCCGNTSGIDNNT